MSQKLLVLILSAAALAATSAAQDTPPEPPAPVQPETPLPAGGRGGAAQLNGEPQPYDRVVTKEAKTQKGIFTVHQIRERYLLEIPKAEFDREFLWNTQIARTTLGAGYGGPGGGGSAEAGVASAMAAAAMATLVSSLVPLISRTIHLMASAERRSAI